MNDLGLDKLSLPELATMISVLWPDMNTTARACVDNLRDLASVREAHFGGPAWMQIVWFLVNSKDWTGANARAMKKELRVRVKALQ